MLAAAWQLQAEAFEFVSSLGNGELRGNDHCDHLISQDIETYSYYSVTADCAPARPIMILQHHSVVPGPALLV